MYLRPEYGHYGSEKTLRAWRSLNGWKLLSPQRTRKPVPWAVWIALAWRLAVRASGTHGYLYSASCDTLLLAFRAPDSACSGPAPPSWQVVSHWSPLIAPRHRHRASKTGRFLGLCAAGRATHSIPEPAASGAPREWRQRSPVDLHLSGSGCRPRRNPLRAASVSHCLQTAGRRSTWPGSYET